MTLPSAFLTHPIAHRALHDVTVARPENSRAAVRAAVAAGYGIEIDVQPSADGVPMVFHDEELDRMTGVSGPIVRRAAADLVDLTLRHGTEGVPTLAQVLEDVAGKVPLLIEIKDQDGGLGPNVGALERAVAKVLAGYQGPVAVMSFNPHSMAAMAVHAPDVPRGLTTDYYAAEHWPGVSAEVRERLRGIPDFDRVGASFISHQAADLGNPAVTALKARGVPILCWTIRSPEAEARARKVADNVTFEGYAA
jgi:glycerophosphoryl diester phosphodiesterase